MTSGGQQRQNKDTRTQRGQERIRQQQQEREARKAKQHEAVREAQRRRGHGKPAFVPTLGDDVLLAVTIAALVAGTGVSTLAIWVNAGWGGAIGFFAVFGLLGIGAIVIILQNKDKQRTALWWLTAIGAAVALVFGLWLVA